MRTSSFSVMITRRAAGENDRLNVSIVFTSRATTSSMAAIRCAGHSARPAGGYRGRVAVQRVSPPPEPHESRRSQAPFPRQAAPSSAPRSKSSSPADQGFRSTCTPRSVTRTEPPPMFRSGLGRQHPTRCGATAPPLMEGMSLHPNMGQRAWRRDSKWCLIQRSKEGLVPFGNRRGAASYPGQNRACGGGLSTRRNTGGQA